MIKSTVKFIVLIKAEHLHSLCSKEHSI